MCVLYIIYNVNKYLHTHTRIAAIPIRRDENRDCRATSRHLQCLSALTHCVPLSLNLPPIGAPLILKFPANFYGIFLIN